MWQERIEVDPAVLVGKPVIKGTRLAVEFLLDLMAEGWTAEVGKPPVPPAGSGGRAQGVTFRGGRLRFVPQAFGDGRRPGGGTYYLTD